MKMPAFITNLFEKRSAIDDSRHWKTVDFSMKTGAGVNIGPNSCLSYSAVYGCVRNIAEDIGKLPLILYRAIPGGGKERATTDPLYNLLRHTPNSEMSALSFRQTITAHAMLWQGGYAWIQRDGLDRPVALWPLRPDRVTAKRRGGKLGAVYFEVRSDTGTAVEYDDADIFHIEGLGFDGIQGYALAARAKESFGITAAAEKFAASFFGKGSSLSGVLMHPKLIGTKETRDELRASWEEIHSGPDNANKIAILQEGMTYAQTGIEPNKAQFLESRQFQIEEVCRWFRMPPHKLQHLLRSTNNNIEHQGLEYVTDTLGAWLVRWEQEIKRKLILDPAEDAEHLVDALLRGDTLSRYQAYNLALTMGWIKRDEIRAKENLNPLPDGEGDVILVPINYTTMEKLMAAPTEPAVKTPAPADPPAGATRSAVIRPIFADSIGRMLRKESLAARKAAKKPDEFGAWIAEFYGPHETHVRDALAPGMDASIALRDGPNFNRQRAAEATEKAAKTHCEASMNQLRSAFTMGHRDGLELRVNSLCDKWEKHRAGDFAESLSKGATSDNG